MLKILQKKVYLFFRGFSLKAVVQRVKRASVMINQQVYSSIGAGLLIFIGLSKSDEISDGEYLNKKILNLRIFEDEQGKFNYNVKEVGGEILIVSQFTLLANTKKGNRPSFTDSMAVQEARLFFKKLVSIFKNSYDKVKTGEFQAKMNIQLENDGPVTIILDSGNC